MLNKVLHGVAASGFSKYATPIIERFVYGLVYPAVLGASLVEFGLSLKVSMASIPWLLLLLVFVIDYAVTASEISEAPPKGNLFMAMADLVAACAFLGAYFVFVAWDGVTPFTGAELNQLVFVIFGLQFAYVLWYVFRLSTKGLAGVDGEGKENYFKMLKHNSVSVGIQTILVVILGFLITTGRANLGMYYVMMAVVLIGVAYRVYNDFMLGPVRPRRC